MVGLEFGNREAVELERAARYVLWKIQNESEFGPWIKIIKNGHVYEFEILGGVLDRLNYLDPLEFSAFLDNFAENLTRLARKRRLR